MTNGASLDKVAAQMLAAVHEAIRPRPVETTSTGKPGAMRSMKLAWKGLYDDNGLLASETQAKGTMREAGFQRAKPEPMKRRLSRAETIATLASYAEAKPLKPTVQMALRLARDSSSTVEDLARVIKQDQALATRVLQLANSSLHRRGAPTRTIEQAIIRLGMGVLRETISSTAVLDQFESPDGVLNIQMLWEHGYAVGMLAADLSRATRKMSPDNAFLIGLLHDMGRAIMAGQIGQDYIDALLTARRSDLRPSRVEKSFFELNHADVADVLFREWDFDDSIVAPIANHHLSSKNAKHLDPAHFKHTQMLKLADNLAHAALLGDSGCDWINTKAFNVERQPLSPGLVRTCVQRAAKTLEELRLLLASTPGAEAPEEHACVVRAQLPKELTLAAGTSTDAVDVLDVLAWRLCESDLDSSVPTGGPYGPGDVPDVVLATLYSMKQVAELSSVLEGYDQEDQRVALVIVSHIDDIRAACPALFVDRHVQVLPADFRLAWVIRAINELYSLEEDSTAAHASQAAPSGH